MQCPRGASPLDCSLVSALSADSEVPLPSITSSYSLPATAFIGVPLLQPPLLKITHCSGGEHLQLP